MKTIQKEIQTILKISDDKEKTFSITKITDGDMKKHMIIVLLYPTRTEENMIADDDTVNYIMSHLRELGFDSFTIINLFSKVVKSCRMSVRGIQVDEENLTYIKEQFINNDAFRNSTWVIAWGQTAGRSKVVCHAKMELLEAWKKKFPRKKLYQLSAPGLESSAGVVPHPLYLGIRKRQSRWTLTEVDFEKLMKLSSGKIEQEKKNSAL